MNALFEQIFFLFELKSSLLLKINSSLIAENAPNFKNYEVLGLNADHTYFCGSIQLIEEIINHKAQPQGNSPLSAGFYYHLDCLKECLFVLILASVILFICRQTLVFPTPNLFFDTSKTRKGGGWSPSDHAASFPVCGSWTELFEIWNSSSINSNVSKNTLIRLCCSACLERWL